MEASQTSLYDRFSGLESFVFHFGRRNLQEDFSRLDSLGFREMSKTLGGEFYGSRQFCFSFRRRTLLNDTTLRSESLAYLTVLLSVSAEKNTRLRVRSNLTVLLFISAEDFTDRQLRGGFSHSTRQNIENKDFRKK